MKLTRRELTAALLATAATHGQSTELVFLSAATLARMIRKKKVSAREVVDAHIARIHSVNPKINAVGQTCFERALKEAKQADEKLAHGEAIGPLHGVPMRLKDSIDTADVITTAGTLGRINYIPKKDATVAARLRKAGAILLGKTNTPELTLVAGPFPGIFGTANIIYGVSRNPYDLTRVQQEVAGAPPRLSPPAALPSISVLTGAAACAVRPTIPESPPSSLPREASLALDTSSITEVCSTRGSNSGRWLATSRI